MSDMKEVRYDEYCKKCVYEDLDESQDPCDDCLNEPFNIDSRKPVCYKEDADKKNKENKEKK